MSATRLRVLHCIYDDPDNPWVGGGGSRRAFDLYRHLRDDVDATMLTGNHPGASTAPIDGIRVIRAGARQPYAWSRLTYAAAASRALRTSDYDVAVVDHSAYTPIVIPRDRPVGIILHHLTGPVAAERWGVAPGAMLGWLERTLVRRSRVFSATSAASVAAIEPFVRGDAIIARVSSGVSDHLFDLQRHDEGYALYIGRLDIKQKGIDVLLDAFAMLVRRVPGATLRIAGRGPDDAWLRERSTSLGIAGAVRFLGAVTDTERDDLLAGAAFQVVPSRFEGFGIVAAEALAAGVPLIVSDDPALVEIVQEPAPGAGVVVPRGDARALAGAMLSLLADGEARHRLSRTGRERAERFRWHVVAGEHLEFLRRVLRAHTTSGASPSS
jgi:glycosyltransferase involved in cell wall biosynthesis